MTARLLTSLTTTLFLAVLAVVAGTALFGVSGWFLTATALAGAGAAFNLAIPSALVRGLSLLRIASRYGERLIGHAATLSLLERLREGVFRRLVPLAPLSGRARRRGDLLSRLTADVEVLDAVFIGVLAPTLAALVAAVAFTTLLAFVLGEAALPFAVGFAVAGLLAPAALTAAALRDGAEFQDRQAAFRASVLDTIDGHANLVACAAVARASHALTGDVSALARIGRRRVLKEAFAVQVSQLAAVTTWLTVLLVALTAHAEGRLGGALLVGLLLGALVTLETAAALTRNSGRLATAVAAADRVRGLVSGATGNAEPSAPLPIATAGTLVFEGVSARRRPERLLLKHATFAIHAGERVAVVGESGAGKSTLFDLVLRLLEPDGGRILVGGINVRDLAHNDLFRQVALLEQDPPVFLGSVRDNLRMGREEADDEALWAALRAARADAFVEGLPDGMDTWLGQGGRTLSVGEARRLCLARILLTPADILLLDEPTSGLDRDAELAFLLDLPSATEGRTVLLATHAALPDGCVDRQLCIKDGGVRILEA